MNIGKLKSLYPSLYKLYCIEVKLQNKKIPSLDCNIIRNRKDEGIAWSRTRQGGKFWENIFKNIIPVYNSYKKYLEINTENINPLKLKKYYLNLN